MNVLDLFSGIGGFSLGLERAGFTTVAFCEIEPYCRAVLRKHWPGVPIFRDIKHVTAKSVAALGPIDIVTGGFPCQPFSHAGQRRGAEDDRHLWPEMLRVVAELRPTWVIGENVPGLINLGLDGVLSDLEGEGYATRTFNIGACAVNAPHRRQRLWVVGYAHESGSGSQRQIHKCCDNASRGGEDVANAGQRRRAGSRAGKGQLSRRAEVVGRSKVVADCDGARQSASGGAVRTQGRDDIRGRGEDVAHRDLAGSHRAGKHQQREAELRDGQERELGPGGEALGDAAGTDGAGRRCARQEQEQSRRTDELGALGATEGRRQQEQRLGIAGGSPWAEFERASGRRVKPLFRGIFDGLSSLLDRGLIGADRFEYWTQKSAEIVSGNEMREMRQHQSASAPSPGPQCEEQRDGECRGSLPEVPHSGTHDGWDMGNGADADESLRRLWQAVCAEVSPIAGEDLLAAVSKGMGTDLLATKVENRVARLTALGNAVVPQIPEIIGRAIIEAEGMT